MKIYTPHNKQPSHHSRLKHSHTRQIAIGHVCPRRKKVQKAQKAQTGKLSKSFPVKLRRERLRNGVPSNEQHVIVECDTNKHRERAHRILKLRLNEEGSAAPLTRIYLRRTTTSSSKEQINSSSRGPIVAHTRTYLWTSWRGEWSWRRRPHSAKTTSYLSMTMTTMTVARQRYCMTALHFLQPGCGGVGLHPITRCWNYCDTKYNACTTTTGSHSLRDARVPHLTTRIRPIITHVQIQNQRRGEYILFNDEISRRA